jgi:hypothetical protein
MAQQSIKNNSQPDIMFMLFVAFVETNFSRNDKERVFDWINRTDAVFSTHTALYCDF